MAMPASAMNFPTTLQNQQQEQLSKEFAQHGVQWRVDDAKRAGIHPLAALGFNSPSAPQMQNSQVYSNRRNNTGGHSGSTQAYGEFAQAVLGIFKAVIPYIAQKNTGTIQGQGLDIEKAELDKLVQTLPAPRQATHPSNQGIQAGHGADIKYVKTLDGGMAIVPSDYAKESMEDQLVPEALFALRNYVLPQFNPDTHKPPQAPPAGKKWVWDGVRQAYYPKPLSYNTDSFLGLEGWKELKNNPLLRRNK